MPLTALIVLGALVCDPARQHHSRSTTTSPPGSPRRIPSTRTTSGSARSSAAPATLIVALQGRLADRCSRATTLAFIERITGDIERVDTVQRVASLATATIVEAPVPTAASTCGRCSTSAARRRRPDAVRRRALERRADSRRSRVGGRHGHGDGRQLRRGPHRRSPRRRDPADPRPRRSAACRRASGRTTTAASRSARPTTASRSTTSASSRRRSSLFTHRGDLSRPFARGGRRCSRMFAVGDQRPVDARPLLADGLHLQRPLQHDRPADRRPGDCRRRAHDAALGRGAAARRQRARVQGDRRAPGGAAARRQRDDGARACCRWPPATSSPCARSASGRRSASWWTSSFRWCSCRRC